MHSNPRTSVNLLVILVQTLVNLLVKLTKLRLGGCHRGLGSGEYTRERLVPLGVAKNPIMGAETLTVLGSLGVGWLRDCYEAVMGLLLGILLGILPDLLGFY